MAADARSGHLLVGGLPVVDCPPWPNLEVAVAEPVAVGGELGDLAERLEHRGIRLLREVLARPASHGPAEVSRDEAARMTGTYRALLDALGDGVQLTAAGFLPPSVVLRIAEATGIADWWIGKANREDLTRPVADLRRTARALGLVSVRKGRLAPTAAAVRCGRDPLALWQHVVARLPLGRQDAERHAGWMALAVVGSGAPPEEWDGEISDLLHAIGWRSGHDRLSPPPARSETLEVLGLLAGAARNPWGEVRSTEPALAATARAAIRAGSRA